MPTIIRPPRDEEPPNRPKPKATPKAKAKAKPTAPTLAPGGRMSDSELYDALVDAYKTLGTIEAGAGYLRRNPGLALAGFNVIARAEEEAKTDLAACKANPRLRGVLVGMLQNSVMMTFIGGKVTLLAPTLAAFVPHPVITGIANRSIAPDAHAMAITEMPDLFGVPSSPEGEPTGEPVTNNTDGQA